MANPTFKSSLAAATWLILATLLVFGFQDRMYSTSIDFASHGTLVSRLMSGWTLNPMDVSLEEMAIYPRVAHRIASLAGRLTGSAINGMQVTAILSLFLLWSMVGMAFSGLSRNRYVTAIVVLMVLTVVGNRWFGIEFFGSELVNSYYFAQLVAQSFGLAPLVMAMRKEWSTPDSLAPLALLGICVPLLASVHLLPALELLGTLTVLAMLRASTHIPGKWLARNLPTAGIITISTALLFFNPDFRSMVRISTNNGGISLRYVTDIQDAIGLAAITALVCGLMLFQWWRKRNGLCSYLDLLHKYLGAFGLATTGLCLAQVFLLKFFSLGSPYACFKYVVAMQSILAINSAVLFAGCFRPSAKRPGYWQLGGIVFAATMCMCTFAGPLAARTNALVAAEISARQFSITRADRAPMRYDFALGIKDVPNVGNYFLSRGVLGAPGLGISMDVLYSRIPAPPEQVDQILTSKGVDPWDVPACRRGSAGDLIVLDGACVFENFGDLECTGTIEFTSRGALDKASHGLTHPGGDGRWSEGSTALLTCKRPEPAPTIAYLETAGLVSETHSQRMTVWVNGRNPKTIEYSAQSPAHTVELTLPADNSAQITFQFEFPDAISPAELGMNSDQRKLAVFMYRMRFE